MYTKCPKSTEFIALQNISKGKGPHYAKFPAFQPSNFGLGSCQESFPVQEFPTLANFPFHFGHADSGLAH